MKKHLVLMKLGGSVITDKVNAPTTKNKSVLHFVDDFRQTYEQLSGVDFIFGTGAGSWHRTAYEYQIHAQQAPRMDVHPEQSYGMAVTHNGVQRISGLTADEFTSRNIPVFTVSPSSMFTLHDGEVASSYFESIRGMLAMGIIPVLHGDTLVDDVRGTTIMSTEETLYNCAKHFRSEYATITMIYLLDTGGLLDKDGKIISELKPDEELFVHKKLGYDISGGIEGKIKSGRKAAQLVDAVYLLGGDKPGAVGRAISGKRVGTRVL